ncbi:MAG TPA: pepsin/retropepsin-like aspartic protease family protein [Planctomycetota bacterium]|jgi:hypothetical protein|nr:pepsin/retropepsin-like aspartic protease family protein [Planctomycetota bacterium]
MSRGLERSVRNRLLLLLLFLATGPPVGPSCAPADKGSSGEGLEQVLAKVRGATGFEALREMAGGVLVEGSASFAGTEAAFTLRFAPGGEFVERIVGPLSLATGFDGATAWSVDFSGMPRALALREREVALLAAWIWTGRWLAEDGPLAISPAPGAGPLSLAFRLKGGVAAGRVEIDRSTFLPAQMTVGEEGNQERVRLEDWRPALGFPFPHRVVRTDPEGAEMRFQVNALAPAPAAPTRPFGPPRERPADAAFDPDVPPQLAVHTSRTGHLLVRPLLEGEIRGSFILDTGASGLIVSRKTAEAARLEVLGPVRARGAGGGADAAIRRGKVLSLGPLTIRDPLYGEIDLDSMTEPLGEEIAGLLGYDLFARAAVVIDAAQRAVELHDPGRFVLRGGEWQELLLHEGQPCVRARFEGNREGLFRLDSGSPRSTVTFHAPAVRALHLLESRETSGSVARGVGGEAAVRVGRLEWFEIGGLRFEEPLTRFSLAGKGSHVDEYTLGYVGLGFLSSFRLVLDYRNGRIAFLPSGTPR